MLPSDLHVWYDASQSDNVRFNGTACAPQSSVDTAGLLVQPTSGDQPNFDDLSLAYGPGIILGAQGSPDASSHATYLNIPSFSLGIPFSIVFFGAIDGDSCVFEMSAGANVGSSQGVKLTSSNSTTVTVHGPSGTQTANAASGWFSDNSSHVIVLTCDGTTTSLYMDGSPVTLTPAGSAPGTGSITVTGVLGATQAAGSFSTGMTGFFASVNRVLSNSEITENVQDYFTSSLSWYISKPSSVTINLLGGGDSIAVGHGTEPTDGASIPYAFLNMTAKVLGARAQGGVTGNQAVSSARLTNPVPVTPVITQWTSSCVPLVVSGITNLFSLEGGINDCSDNVPANNAQARSNAALIWGYYNTVIAQVVSDLNGIAGGPHYVLCNTITPSANSNYMAKQIYLINQYIRQRCAGYSTSNVKVILMDIGLGGDAVMGNVLDVGYTFKPAYGGDPLHPAKPGHRRWGGVMAKKIISLGL